MNIIYTSELLSEQHQVRADNWEDWKAEHCCADYDEERFDDELKGQSFEATPVIMAESLQPLIDKLFDYMKFGYGEGQDFTNMGTDFAGREDVFKQIKELNEKLQQHKNVEVSK